MDNFFFFQGKKFRMIKVPVQMLTLTRFMRVPCLDLSKQPTNSTVSFALVTNLRYRCLGAGPNRSNLAQIIKWKTLGPISDSRRMRY